MLSILKPVLVTVMFLSASVAYAGGPVILEEGNNELITAEAPASRIGILPVLGALVLVCLIACGGDDEPEPVVDK